MQLCIAYGSQEDPGRSTELQACQVSAAIKKVLQDSERGSFTADQGKRPKICRKQAVSAAACRLG